MDEHFNNLGQPIGFSIEEGHERPRPPRSTMTGDFCKVEPLNPDTHATDLYQAYAKDKDHRNWTYLPYGPFNSFQDYQTWLKTECLSDDPLFHTIIDKVTAKAVGVASYLRIEPSVGVIEVGHIHFSPQLQRTVAATEATYLMMRRVFDELGYRRYEWKCDALNAGSRKAAVRLGFSFEGVFRQATIYKGRNRDTAWYSIIDREWPMLKQAFEKWLDPANFDAQGRQRETLSNLVSQAKIEAHQRSGCSS